MARLDAIEEHLHVLTNRRAEHQATSDDIQELSTQIDASTRSLSESLDTLQKKISRTGKEQFKANSLMEVQTAKYNAALDMLRSADEQRTIEWDTIQEHADAIRNAARREVAHALLPVIDSLDEAMRSGSNVLRQIEQTERQVEQTPSPSPHPTFFERLFAKKPESEPEPSQQQDVDTTHIESLSKAMSSWLTGLTFVTNRLIQILEAEDIRPMPTTGHLFDPHLHIVLETTPASEDMPEGTITTELRRGYMIEDRVLRHAEVVVARMQHMNNNSEGNT